MTAPAHVENVLSRLQKVKKSGQGWMALCPAHQDNAPSLSVGVGADGRALLRCFAGCSAEEILAAMGLGFRDLFRPQSGGGIRNPRLIRTKPPTSPRAKRERPRDLDREAENANGCRHDLCTSEEALAYLWHRRGIGPGTALDWGMGVKDVRRAASGRIVAATWTLPVICHQGTRPLIGVKLHRDPPRTGEAKAGWLVRGGAALFPLIEAQALEPGALIVLAPGELKALAYIQAGIPATSLTTGEATRWTPELAMRFAGLAVAIDPDREDSDTARAFVSNAARALKRVALSIEVCVTQELCEVCT